MSEIQKHVPSLATCKVMQELGFDVETVFVWVKEDNNVKITLRSYVKANNFFFESQKHISEIIAPAPIATEIELPEYQSVKRISSEYFDSNSSYCFIEKSEIECRAKLWIELRKEKEV